MTDENGFAEVRKLLAYEEIRQLAARYALAVDSRDLDALCELFVEDVRVTRETSGRAALRASFAEQLRPLGVTILNVGTHVIDLLDDDHATGHVYCKGEIQEGPRWIHQAILYRDVYERRDGRWLFVRRRHDLWYGANVGANPAGLPPANWPERSYGSGTVPALWKTWQDFTADGDTSGQP
ncbi:nuclear transport factor 2 family protein [Yinghuangia seranimata]|uniref:nuclear transport factor 2 family protein n=1 Tax=Yinghuangia seranimata TaxID=408067 RepID=UPI00248B76F7|nr:nuclear transport factor 2 family protein [Yinghuangia seranimata]MDI2132666.1 nuclear transport factor 2 family protein [Yinghuangia seranimata]